MCVYICSDLLFSFNGDTVVTDGAVVLIPFNIPAARPPTALAFDGAVTDTVHVEGSTVPVAVNSSTASK